MRQTTTVHPTPAGIGPRRPRTRAPAARVKAGPDGFIQPPHGYPLSFRRMWLESLRGAAGSSRATLGLSFRTTRFVRPGAWLEVSIPLRGETQRFRGEVVMVKAGEGGFEVGLWLENDQDAARARIVEQICYIECYLRRKRESGAVVSGNGAAREWITRFAASFPVI